MTDAGHELADQAIVRDDIAQIREQIEAWVASGSVDAIITTGGTGITGRDVTPEARRAAVRQEDRRLLGGLPPGQLPVGGPLHPAEPRHRRASSAASSCSACPAPTGRCKDGWDKVISAQLDSRHGPCNMVELMPRLLEQ